MKRPIVHALLLIVLSTVCAVASNALAARQRKLVLPGYYPNALRVPQRAPAQAPVPAPAPEPVAEQSPAPGQPPIEIPTTTVARPAGTGTVTPPAPQAAAPAPAPTPTPAPAEVPVSQRFPPHPDRPSVDISGADAAWLHGRGVLFLDARRTSVYQEGHIAGARPFSVWESDIDQKVARLFEERSDPEEQNLPIVIYCSGGACEDSHMLAEKLWGVQFNNVYVYKDGYPDWLSRGGAVRKGATP
ncbi:MAG TPA: rhodanese-like domain-containing protein [Thermoanaerobaculia bacterium]|nr:rhodanese-like domain-containing protein [Thermoanaerobaculia bacterium]